MLRQNSGRVRQITHKTKWALNSISNYGVWEITFLCDYCLYFIQHASLGLPFVCLLPHNHFLHSGFYLWGTNSLRYQMYGQLWYPPFCCKKRFPCLCTIMVSIWVMHHALMLIIKCLLHKLATPPWQHYKICDPAKEKNHENFYWTTETCTKIPKFETLLPLRAQNLKFHEKPRKHDPHLLQVHILWTNPSSLNNIFT